MKIKNALTIIPVIAISSYFVGYQVACYNIEKAKEEELLLARLNTGLWMEDYETSFVTHSRLEELKKIEITKYFYKSLSNHISGEEMYNFIAKTLKKHQKLVNYQGCTKKIDPLLIACIIYRESRFNPNLTSSMGAIGLIQVMPIHLKTLKQAKIVDNMNKKELFEWKKNVEAGIYVLLSYAKLTNDITTGLMMYNAGPNYYHLGAKYASRILRDYQEVEKLWKQ
jgi:hypothetical protein